MHSCAPTPPCAFSTLAQKHPIPGGEASLHSHSSAKDKWERPSLTHLAQARIVPTLIRRGTPVSRPWGVHRARRASHESRCEPSASPQQEIREHVDRSSRPRRQVDAPTQHRADTRVHRSFRSPSKRSTQSLKLSHFEAHLFTAGRRNLIAFKRAAPNINSRTAIGLSSKSASISGPS
jgi:hypothetical protein